MDASLGVHKQTRTLHKHRRAEPQCDTDYLAQSRHTFSPEAVSQKPPLERQPESVILH